MALDTKLSDATVNVEANAVAALLNGGAIELRDGTKPPTADTAETGYWQFDNF